MNRLSLCLVAALFAASVVPALLADDPKPNKPGDAPREKRDAQPLPPPNPVDLEQLKKQISDAALKGNFEEVSKLTRRLEDLLKNPAAPKRDGDRPQGDRPRDGDRPKGRDLDQLRPDGGNKPKDIDALIRLREEMLRTMKGFEDTIQSLTGNPEAQEAVRKAMEAYRASMRDQLKDLPAVPFPGGRGLAFGGGAFGGGFGLGGGFPGNDFFGPNFFFPPQQRGGLLGLQVQPTPDYVSDLLDLPKNLGVLVVNVLPNSPAEKAGFRKNDLVLNFGGEEVTSPSQFVQLVEKASRDGKPVDVSLFRKGKREILKAVQVPKEEPRTEMIPFNAMSVRIFGNSFAIEAANPSVQYKVEGDRGDAGNTVTKVTITPRGGEAKTYNDLQDVPAEHQAAVKQLLNNIR